MLYPIELWVHPEALENYKPFVVRARRIFAAMGVDGSGINGLMDNWMDGVVADALCLFQMLQLGGDFLCLAEDAEQVEASDFLELGPGITTPQ